MVTPDDEGVPEVHRRDGGVRVEPAAQAPAVQVDVAHRLEGVDEARPLGGGAGGAAGNTTKTNAAIAFAAMNIDRTVGYTDGRRRYSQTKNAIVTGRCSARYAVLSASTRPVCPSAHA